MQIEVKWYIFMSVQHLRRIVALEEKWPRCLQEKCRLVEMRDGTVEHFPERLSHRLGVWADELCDEGEDGGVRVAVELGEEADGEGLEEGAVDGAGERAPDGRRGNLEGAAESPQGEGGSVTRPVAETRPEECSAVSFLVQYAFQHCSEIRCEFVLMQMQRTVIPQSPFEIYF